MPCPHCGQEHPESDRLCPNTGLPLGQPVVCANCGRAARPGSHYCATCGAVLPRLQPTTQPPAAAQDRPGSLSQGSSNAGQASGAPSQPVSQTPAPPPSESAPNAPPAAPVGSQRLTRPSVSLVEISRRQTRLSQGSPQNSSHAAQRWDRLSLRLSRRLSRPQSHLWHVLGYVLLILVLLAGAAGLFLLWSQMHPPESGLLFMQAIGG